MLLEPQALLSGVKNGNRLMFTLCYDRYHRGIYLFVLKYVRCEALAEDIVQEVFFRLWCNRRGLREEGNLAALLYAMAKNLTVNAIRKHKIVETGNVRYYDLHEGRQEPAGEHLRVLLADGSAVTLNACSELRYPERFARRRREVRLVRGEAFFEVAHDASAPFTVETDDVSVEVLGTKFNVNAYDKEVTTVYLKEGKVRLTERVTGRQNRYLMAPDEMLAVDRNARTCRAVRPAGKSAPEAWLHNNYAFTNAPLEDVVEFLERHYAVEIEVADARILQYSYTMEFYNETIDEVLSVMSQITPIRYSRVNDRITVRAAR